MNEQERIKLQLYVVELLKKHGMSTSNDVLREALGDSSGIPNEAINKAFSSRGKTKGCLKADRPNGDAGIVWQGIMANVNPMRASVWFVMTLNQREQDLYYLVDAVCEVFMLVGRAKRRLRKEAGEAASAVNIDQLLAENARIAGHVGTGRCRM